VSQLRIGYRALSFAFIRQHLQQLLQQHRGHLSTSPGTVQFTDLHSSSIYRRTPSLISVRRQPHTLSRHYAMFANRNVHSAYLVLYNIWKDCPPLSADCQMPGNIMLYDSSYDAVLTSLKTAALIHICINTSSYQLVSISI